MSLISNTVPYLSFLISAAIASDLAIATWYWLSVKITTPNFLVPDLAIAYEAAVRETTKGSVVTFVFIPRLGPGVGPECHPNVGMPAAVAATTCAACSVASVPPRIRASTLSAIAAFIAVVRPLGVA
ncbi:unannotated protein [freshwater metagenome]|uniref:Unannotated protein n=1 Tax=freshwater metagenome TaxID=449393 RepID=A0A6J6YZT2_9ZZZZ